MIESVWNHIWTVCRNATEAEARQCFSDAGFVFGNRRWYSFRLGGVLDFWDTVYWEDIWENRPDVQAEGWLRVYGSALERFERAGEHIVSGTIGSALRGVRGGLAEVGIDLNQVLKIVLGVAIFGLFFYFWVNRRQA